MKPKLGLAITFTQGAGGKIGRGRFWRSALPFRRMSGRGEAGIVIRYSRPSGANPPIPLLNSSSGHVGCGSTSALGMLGGRSGRDEGFGKGSDPIDPVELGGECPAVAVQDDPGVGLEQDLVLFRDRAGLPDVNTAGLVVEVAGVAPPDEVEEVQVQVVGPRRRTFPSRITRSRSSPLSRR